MVDRPILPNLKGPLPSIHSEHQVAIESKAMGQTQEHWLPALSTACPGYPDEVPGTSMGVLLSGQLRQRAPTWDLKHS